jgi:cell division protein FtsQ
MRKWLKIVLVIGIFVGVIVVFIKASEQEAKTQPTLPQIAIHVDSENAFLTEQELINRLKMDRLIYEGQTNEALKIDVIEAKIAAMEEVKTVRVYRDIGKKWYIKIELRKPIARIFTIYGESYYLDEDGFTMNRSELHTARTLVFSGNIKDDFNRESVADIINNDSLKSIRKLDDIYRISNYVCKDPLLHKLIGQVYLEKDGDFVLVPLIGDQKIVFGTAYSEEEVKEKFKRLKIFYKEAIPYEGWAKYSEISVKYDGQIVCRKRGE